MNQYHLKKYAPKYFSNFFLNRSEIILFLMNTIYTYFAADTIFMPCVIFLIFFADLMRIEISFNEDILQFWWAFKSFQHSRLNEHRKLFTNISISHTQHFARDNTIEGSVFLKSVIESGKLRGVRISKNLGNSIRSLNFRKLWIKFFQKKSF